MQLDYTKWIFYIVYALGGLLIAFLVRAYYIRTQMDDSDKLKTPSYERMDSGIKISVDDEEDDP